MKKSLILLSVQICAEQPGIQVSQIAVRRLLICKKSRVANQQLHLKKIHLLIITEIRKWIRLWSISSICKEIQFCLASSWFHTDFINYVSFVLKNSKDLSNSQLFWDAMKTTAKQTTFQLQADIILNCVYQDFPTLLHCCDCYYTSKEKYWSWGVSHVKHKWENQL